jgi:hypothetical protein
LDPFHPLFRRQSEIEAFFGEVTYVDEEFDYEDIDNLLMKYPGTSAILTGTIQTYSWNDHVMATSFLPLFWMGAVLGIPSGHNMTKLKISEIPVDKDESVAPTTLLKIIEKAIDNLTKR